DPTKQWKFNPSDLDDSKAWPAFMEAYEAALAETSTDAAPWYIVPANKKWYRNWAVMTIMTETLRQMDPQYPT
ncbi:MAG: polyphosphate kinase 2 family protein, partial [Acidimicrobiales bacterium]|nr:polyphosphate kinase 2 family protein [Acidimicrobiales bacterium]